MNRPPLRPLASLLLIILLSACSTTHFQSETAARPRETPGIFLMPLNIELSEVNAGGVADAQRPKVENIRPQPLAGQPGFAFDFSFTSKNGLDFRGFGRGTIKNDMLYLVTYHGTRLRYFDKYREDAETVIGSARLL